MYSKKYPAILWDRSKSQHGSGWNSSWFRAADWCATFCYNPLFFVVFVFHGSLPVLTTLLVLSRGGMIEAPDSQVSWATAPLSEVYHEILVDSWLIWLLQVVTKWWIMIITKYYQIRWDGVTPQTHHQPMVNFWWLPPSLKKPWNLSKKTKHKTSCGFPGIPSILTKISNQPSFINDIYLKTS